MPACGERCQDKGNASSSSLSRDMYSSEQANHGIDTFLPLFLCPFADMQISYSVMLESEALYGHREAWMSRGGY